MPTSFRALRDKNYRKFFFYQLISMSGTWMQGIAQSWLMYKLTNAGWWLGVIVFCNHFPAFIIGPVAGVIADHGDRRKLLTVVESIQMSQAFVLGALVWSGKVQPWHIACMAIVLGFAEGFDITLRHAFTPGLAKKENLSSAIALNAVIVNISRILGPTVAGLVIGGVGDAWCFFLNGLSFAPMIWWLFRLPREERPRLEERPAFLQSLASGWGFIVRHPLIFRLIIVSTFVCIVLSMYIALLPIFAKTVLGGTAKTLGWLTSMLGLGAITGAIFFGKAEDVHQQASEVKKFVFLYGMSILAFSLSRHWALSAGAMYCVGFSQMGVFPRINFVLNSLVAENMRGRVMSVYTMTFMGTVPIGGLISGWCADRVGAPAVTAVAGLTGIAGAAVLYFMEGVRNGRHTKRAS